MYERGHAPFKATARAATLLKSAVTAKPSLPSPVKEPFSLLLSEPI